MNYTQKSYKQLISKKTQVTHYQLFNYYHRHITRNSNLFFGLIFALYFVQTILPSLQLYPNKFRLSF